MIHYQRQLIKNLLVSVCLSVAVSTVPVATAIPVVQNDSTDISVIKPPMIFEPNHGRLNQAIDYFTTGKGYTLHLSQSSATLMLRQPGSTESQAVSIDFVDANEHPASTPSDELNSKSHYFIGNDPEKWRRNISHYASIRYEAVYPGIDVVYYGKQGELEYDFIVSPGADPGTIRLQIDGVTGLRIDDSGNLILTTPTGEIVQQKPVIYQSVNGIKKFIKGSYKLVTLNTASQTKQHQVTFNIAGYDTGQTLIIDPVISYATYHGGSNNDSGKGIAVDASGNIYITGDFSIGVSDDAFVTKYLANGMLDYTSYLGGNGIDSGSGIAVDSSGNAYVIGSTNSSNFPTVNQIQGAGGSDDVFVTKLNPTGAIIYSTYLGGSSFDNGRDITIDSLGNAHITGETSSSDFPTQNPDQAGKSGSSDAFVASINSTGDILVYSTFLGGDLTENGIGIVIDSSDNVYVAGSTSSGNFPVTTGVIQEIRGGTSTDSDAFIAKYDSVGVKAFATYFGGSSNDFANDITIDSNGNIYITGETNSDSGSFPVTTGAFQNTKASSSDAFVAKINNDGTTLAYSTYIGGGLSDAGNGIRVDSDGNATITGATNSADFPLQNEIETYGGDTDVFITRFNAAGSALLYSTYIGGGLSDAGLDLSMDSNGTTYVTGSTGSAVGFPVTSDADDPNHNGSPGVTDAFVLKLAVSAEVSIVVQQNIVDPVDINTNLTYTVTVTNNGPDDATGVVVSYTIPAAQGLTYVSSTINQGNCSESSNVVTCTIGTVAAGAMVSADVVVQTPGATASITNTISVAANETDPDVTNNSDSITTTVQPGGNKGSGGGGGGGSMEAVTTIVLLSLLLIFIVRRRTLL